MNTSGCVNSKIKDLILSLDGQDKNEIEALLGCAFVTLFLTNYGEDWEANLYHCVDSLSAKLKESFKNKEEK